MNSIDFEITESDKLNARGKSPTSLAAHGLARLKSAAPYSTTFIQQIPVELQPEVEAELKRKFELWANSWIAPIFREIISKQK